MTAKTSATNDYKTYRQVLRNRIASLKRRLGLATGDYARRRIREQIQETRRPLGREEQE